MGEYSRFVTDYDEVVAALSHPNVANLPPHVQAVYVQSLLKVYATAVAAHAGAVRPPPEAPEPAPAPFDESGGALALAAPGEAGDDDAAAAAAAAATREFPDTELPRSDVLVPMSPELAQLGETIKENLGPFSVSLHLEVRERACQLQTILDIAAAAEAATPGEGVAIVEQFAVALSEEVQPVSLKAQRKVEPPASLMITAPLSERWDDLLVSSGDEDSDDESSRRGKGAKKKKSKHKDVTDLFAQKKSKEQIAQEEQEAREMLARHREKMGNYYLGGEVAKPEPEEGGKKKKKGKKGAPEALPAPPPPEPEMPAYMKASMAGLKMARPEIKGESDSESDEDEAPAEGMGKKALYAPKNSSAALHAGLGRVRPAEAAGPGRGDALGGGVPAVRPVCQRGRRYRRVLRAAHRRPPEEGQEGEAGKDKKASKAKKEEKGGDEKKAKKEKKAEKPAKEKAAKAEKPAKEKKKAKGEKKLSSKMAAVSVER